MHESGGGGGGVAVSAAPGTDVMTYLPWELISHLSSYFPLHCLFPPPGLYLKLVP